MADIHGLPPIPPIPPPGDSVVTKIITDVNKVIDDIQTFATVLGCTQMRQPIPPGLPSLDEIMNTIGNTDAGAPSDYNLINNDYTAYKSDPNYNANTGNALLELGNSLPLGHLKGIVTEDNSAFDNEPVRQQLPYTDDINGESNQLSLLYSAQFALSFLNGNPMPPPNLPPYPGGW